MPGTRAIRRARSAMIAALAFAATAALAVPARAQEQAVVVRADRMLDVTTGRMVTDAVVVVQDGVIQRVGGSVPRDARVIDLGDVTLLPGFIDAHVHLAGAELGPESFMLPVREQAADNALRGAANARRTVEAGFTTVRDMGAGDFVAVAMKRAIERGDIPGPRIIAAGHSLGITGGHCDVTGYRPGVLETSWREGVADGADEAVKAVRYQIKHGAEVIKICATAGVLSFEESVGAQQFSDDEMRAIVAEADRHGLKVAAHAHGVEGIKAAVRAGVASIEHGSILDDEAIALMKEHGTYLVPTRFLAQVIPLDALPAPIREKAEHVLPLAGESFRRAAGAGVRIAFGTDAGVFPHGMNAGEFAVYVQEGGMSELEALRTATVNAAALLGVDDRGSIGPDMLADLVAVPGDPLEDITVTERPVFVMMGGRVVRGADRGS